jgi:hypothetical protein
LTALHPARTILHFIPLGVKTDPLCAILYTRNDAPQARPPTRLPARPPVNRRSGNRMSN